MKMSYMRAWLLIREMNSSFKQPLVEAKRGSVKTGGGAYLTETGLRVIALYQKINAKCLGVTEAERSQLQKLLR
jgi:molybdate transport system regulatory protein